MGDVVKKVAGAMKEFSARPLYNLPSLEGVLVGSLGDAWPHLARAAIAAHLAALSDAGMVVVPREPTEAMTLALDDTDESEWLETDAATVWRTMIVALSTTADNGGGE